MSVSGIYRIRYLARLCTSPNYRIHGSEYHEGCQQAGQSTPANDIRNLADAVHPLSSKFMNLSTIRAASSPCPRVGERILSVRNVAGIVASPNYRVDGNEYQEAGSSTGGQIGEYMAPAENLAENVASPNHRILGCQYRQIGSRLGGHICKCKA